LERASPIRHSASRQRYVLVRQFALHINAYAEKTSTNVVFMVCHVGGLQVVIRDTAPSMI